MPVKYALKVAPEAGGDRGQIAKARNRLMCVQGRKSAPRGAANRISFRTNPPRHWAVVCPAAHEANPDSQISSRINIWSVQTLLLIMLTHQIQSSSFSVNQGCGWHFRGSICIWRANAAEGSAVRVKPVEDMKGTFPDSSKWGQEPSPGEFFSTIARVLQLLHIWTWHSRLLLCIGGESAASLWAEECSSHLCHSSRRGIALACWRLSRWAHLPLLY